jgi:hypothetical protein
MKFRKKPVVIDAIEFTEGSHGAVLDFFQANNAPRAPQIFADYLIIPTLEGDMRADLGDWIIRGVKGEFYPCKPDIFAATYDPAEES